MIGFNRQLVLDAWLKGDGDTRAAPVLPSDLGGQRGIPTTEMAKRPGFPTPRSEDIARARQLIQESGVNIGQFTLQHLNLEAFARVGASEAIGQALTQLGFKVNIQIPSRADLSDKLRRGDFDTHHLVRSINYDDPLDNGGMIHILTNAPSNSGH